MTDWMEKLPTEAERYRRLMIFLSEPERGTIRRRAKMRLRDGDDKLPWHTIVGTRMRAAANS